MSINVSLFWLITMLSAFQCKVTETETDPSVTDSQTMEMKISKLLANIFQPLNEEEIALADTIKDEKGSLQLKDFFKYWKKHNTDKQDIFTIFNPEMRKEAMLLSKALLSIYSLDKFYAVSLWARQYVNYGVFAYALTVALAHNNATRSVPLIPPYEANPYLFINNEAIQKALTIKGSRGWLAADDAKAGGFYRTDDIVSINTNYAGWHLSYSDEQYLSYFTEDVELQSYFYYFHVVYPFWMTRPGSIPHLWNNGENYYYFYQQLLARYILERKSNGLPNIHSLYLDESLPEGYFSSLRHPNGLSAQSRSNYYVINDIQHSAQLEELNECNQKVIESINAGFVTTEYHKKVYLNRPEDIENLADLLRANIDSPTHSGIIRNILSRHWRLKGYPFPTDLENYESSIRDPIFWQLYKNITNYFLIFKDKLKPYTKEDLEFTGLKIQSFEILGELTTYFEPFEVNISNAVPKTKEEVYNQTENLIFTSRMRRLNHEPFTVTIEANLDRNESASSVIRIYLGFEFNKSEILNINPIRHSFVEIDSFSHVLMPGKNVISRNCKEFINLNENMRNRGKEDYKNNIKGKLKNTSKSVGGFPMHLLLPKGSKRGIPLQIYVIIMPKNESIIENEFIDTERNLNSFINFKIFKIDNRALGFPFDRRIADMEAFNVTNAIMKEVLIYHKIKDYPSNLYDKKYFSEILF